jgi:hypothetical protein
MRRGWLTHISLVWPQEMRTVRYANAIIIARFPGYVKAAQTGSYQLCPEWYHCLKDTVADRAVSKEGKMTIEDRWSCLQGVQERCADAACHAGGAKIRSSNPSRSMV